MPGDASSTLATIKPNDLVDLAKQLKEQSDTLLLLIKRIAKFPIGAFVKSLPIQSP